MNKILIVKKIINDSNKLTKLALKERPEAHKESVMVAASIALLEIDMYYLGTLSNSVEIRTLIDDIIDELPRTLKNSIGDTTIGLESAIPNKKLRKSASELIEGAYNTNILGAFEAIYNSQVTDDMEMISEIANGPGPGGETGGYAVLVKRKLFGESDFPTIEILSIINGHLVGVLDAMKSSKKNAGSKACFVATACFESPEHEIVIYLRRFRDAVLKKTGFGRLIVINYYSISPHLAFLIKKNVFLRRFTAKLLRSLVWFLKKFIYKET
jgi:hypothetical protein